jgi:S2P endopeptidase
MYHILRSSAPVLAVGAAYTVLLPSAFVSVSTTAMKSLPAHARLRIISAGAWHNMVLYALVYILGWSGVGSILLLLAGYRDVRAIGKVVLSVDEVRSLWYCPLVHPHVC